MNETANPFDCKICVYFFYGKLEKIFFQPFFEYTFTYLNVLLIAKLAHAKQKRNHPFKNVLLDLPYTKGNAFILCITVSHCCIGVKIFSYKVHFS